MIVSESVTVQLNATTIQYWIDRGYTIPTYVDSKGRVKTFKRGCTKLTVRVADLPAKSNARVVARCSVCSKDREVAFYAYSATCWGCNLAKQKGMEHPRYLHRASSEGTDRAFDLYLRRKYGITSKVYWELFEAQGRACAICRNTQAADGRRFAVDHNHKTGAVRGILCQSCNTGLGLLRDSTEVLKAAAKYLEEKI